MQVQRVLEKEDQVEAAKLLTFIDTENITELDPSRSDGHHVSIEVDLEMCIELREYEQTHSTKESMHLKVLCLGDEQEPGNVRLEITSMEDIFFHYTSK